MKFIFCELSLGRICVCDGEYLGWNWIYMKQLETWGYFCGNTLLNKSSWIIWRVLIDDSMISSQSSSLSLLKLSPPAQPAPPSDWSSLSLGPVDVWPPSMGFWSSLDVSVPPGPPVVVVCHQLEWVICLLPPDGFSACYVAPHMLTQCLSELLASAPWWSTAPWITWQVYQMSFPSPFSPWISYSWQFSFLWSVGVYCKALRAKASGQRHRPPAASSVDLAPQVQVVQVVVVPTFRSQFFCSWKVCASDDDSLAPMLTHRNCID